MRHQSSSAGKPPSAVSAISDSKASTPAPVTLPSDLSTSLKYLDDAQIQRLFDAVNTEINRRRRSGSSDVVAQATRTAPVTASNKTRGVEEISEAKENLIRASFRAGMRPAAIARTLRIPQAVVNRVLDAAAKPTR